MKHSDTTYVTTLANATEQRFPAVFQEKAKPLTLRQVRCSVVTAGVLLKVILDNQQIAAYDCSIFAAGNESPPLEGIIPPQQTLTFSITDLASAGHTNLGVTFVYDVPG